MIDIQSCPIYINTFTWKNLERTTHTGFDFFKIYYIYVYIYIIYIIHGNVNLVQNLGLPASLEKVDGAMKWGYNQKTYFFSGKQRWLC